MELFRILLVSIFLASCSQKHDEKKRPNILFAISDDQSFIHTSFEGCNFVNTPAFDRVAREGIYFKNGYAGSPGCAPSRSVLVTGRHHWQNEQSGQHASSWLKKYIPFVDELNANGYAVGRTAKGVGPFQYARDENDSLWRKEDAAGPAYDLVKYDQSNDERFSSKILNANYAENFKYFIENVKGDKPFFFWYGGKEPHLKYEQGSWLNRGKKLEDVVVPSFLPDNDIIRGDLLDYAVEIEWFDLHLQRMLKYLEKIGELDNTIVIVTSDNGMPFPRAKANAYDYGIHVPLAIRYPPEIKGGQISNTLVSFADLAPTILDATETSPKYMLPFSGESLWELFKSNSTEISRSIFSGRERHSSSRYQNMGYPQRAVRKGDYLFIWNILSDRWPAGAPQSFDLKTNKSKMVFDQNEVGDYVGANIFSDIGPTPTKKYLIQNHNNDEVKKYLLLAAEKRPEFEMYNVVNDMECMINLAGNPDYDDVEQNLKKILFEELFISNDYRVQKEGFDTFDNYVRYSPMRNFPKPEPLKKLSDFFTK